MLQDSLVPIVKQVSDGDYKYIKDNTSDQKLKHKLRLSCFREKIYAYSSLRNEKILPTNDNRPYVIAKKSMILQ